jgi:hypothetical protein
MGVAKILAFQRQLIDREGNSSAMLAPDVRKFVWALTLALGLFYLAFLRPGIYSIDGNSMLAVAESVVTHHDLTVPAGFAFGMAGRDGRLYSSWYPLQSVLAPPLVAALWVSRVSHAPFHVLSTVFVSILPPIFTAVTAGLVFLIARVSVPPLRALVALPCAMDWAPSLWCTRVLFTPSRFWHYWSPLQSTWRFRIRLEPSCSPRFSRAWRCSPNPQVFSLARPFRFTSCSRNVPFDSASFRPSAVA